MKACESAMEWLAENEDASLVEYETKAKHLESLSNAAMAKVYAEDSSAYNTDKFHNFQRRATKKGAKKF